MTQELSPATNRKRFKSQHTSLKILAAFYNQTIQTFSLQMEEGLGLHFKGQTGDRGKMIA
jgi:hypothetical protein